MANDKGLIVNPFFANRAEQMGEEIWRLYVEKPFQNLLGPKPLVFEGGRGCGKSMFFLCNSWREKELKAREENIKLSDIIKSGEPIGIYYKVATSITTSLTGEGYDEKHWTGIFSLYFNLIITKELILLLNSLQEEGGVSLHDAQKICESLATHLGEKQWTGGPLDFFELCEKELKELEIYVNNIGKERNLIIISPGTLITEFAERLRLITGFKKISLHIFVDEYENFFDYQQKIVNTLLKQSSLNLVYDFGIRREGLREKRTLIPNEIIQPPHDYRLFCPESEIGEKEYFALLRSISEKRFIQAGVPEGPKKIWHNIEYYLCRYDINKEVDLLTESLRGKPPFKDRLKAIINKEIEDRDEASHIYQLLAEGDNPLANRLHLCLLLRTNRFRPSIKELVNEYKKWRDKKPTRYKDWMHNAKLGLVFLLCRDYRQPKRYFGFDVFAYLSSGIVRYFLELCYWSFEDAMSNGFSFEKPRILKIEEQTKAARYVSRYKIDDIEAYNPYGFRLKRFVLLLGQTFEALHKRRDETLGEPEPNHFYTQTMELMNDDRKMLDSAIMWAVFQNRLPTKEKEQELPLESEEYHLNHIYCPYFEISYRRKRKLFIPAGLLHTLLFGDGTKAKRAARDILSRHRAEPLSEDELFSPGSHQLSLFD